MRLNTEMIYSVLPYGIFCDVNYKSRDDITITLYWLDMQYVHDMKSRRISEEEFKLALKVGLEFFKTSIAIDRYVEEHVLHASHLFMKYGLYKDGKIRNNFELSKRLKQYLEDEFDGFDVSDVYNRLVVTKMGTPVLLGKRD